MASNYRTDAGLIKTCACGNKSDGLRHRRMSPS